jgi:serine/threonine-protein kinase
MARSGRQDALDTSPRNLGRYRLYGELAAGGMATVHFARQIGSDGFSKLVAIKRLHPQFGKVDEFVEMFLSEARLAARIRHPNVVQPLDVLRVDDEVFLVMEFVEGDSLSRLMKVTVAREERVPLPVATAILSGVLRGLHAAHEAKSDKGEPLGIIHRDVSPQNILVGVDGAPRVIDFGIAKAASSVQITREGELRGKLAYIAPEILSGQRGTRRSDLYAAAVVLWEVLTSQRLFDADYQSAVMANILHRPVEPPSELVKGLPPELDRIVMKGLAREPDERYATAREMAAALEEALPGASAAAVGEWVEVVAGSSLAVRRKRVAQIEALSCDEDVEGEAEEVLSALMTVVSVDPPAVATTAAASRPPARPATTRSAPPPRLPASRIPTLPELAVQPPSRVPTLPEVAVQTPLPPPPPRDIEPPRPRAASTRPPAQPPPPTIVVDEPAAAPPAWPVPGIAPAPAGTTLAVGPRSRSSGSGIVVFMLLTALVLTILYVGLPEFLKRSYASAAAREGVTVTIDSVDVGWRRVRLVGVTATMADLPGFTLHVQSLQVRFSYALDPTDAAAHDAVLSIDGTSAAVQDSLRRARLAHEWKAVRHGTLRQVSVESGHMVWSRAFGEGTRLEAENIGMEVEQSGQDALGDDLTFASPIVDLTAPWGRLGPWSLNAEVDHGQVKATLMLDPSGASKAAASFVVDRGTLTAFDLALPRSNMAMLGVSNALLGRRPDDLLFAEGEAHFAVRSASRVEARVKLDLSGARLAAAIGGADALFEAHADGDPARPIDLTKGAFAFGPFRGAASGSVTFGDTFVRGDISLRTGAARCPAGADVSLGGGLVFDTRILGDARLVVAPSGKCALRILPP